MKRNEQTLRRLDEARRRNERAIRRLDQAMPLHCDDRSLVQVANDASNTEAPGLQTSANESFDRDTIPSLVPPSVAIRDELSGQVIGGRFEVKGQLTSDSLGLLLAALDRKVDRLVSLRVVRSALVASRLAPQLSAVANLTHPNLHAAMGVLRSGRSPSAATSNDDEGSTFLVQGALEGSPVGSQVEARRLAGCPIALREACHIVTAVASALTAVRASGPHGAVGPETVWTDHEGNVLLTDLVLSRALLETDGREGQQARKLLFLAPEVARGGPPQTTSDVYGLSALLYLLLTGLPATEGALAASKLHREATRPLDSVLRRGLSVDPKARHASPATFQAALLDALRAAEREVARASRREAPRTALPTLLSPALSEQPSDSHGPCAPTLEPSLPAQAVVAPVAVSDTLHPEVQPTFHPEVQPTLNQEVQPTLNLEVQPTLNHEVQPTLNPEVQPTLNPEVQPTLNLEVQPAFRVDHPTLDQSDAPEVVSSQEVVAVNPPPEELPLAALTADSAPEALRQTEVIPSRGPVSGIATRVSERLAPWLGAQSKLAMMRSGLCLLLLASVAVLIRAQGSAEHDRVLMRAQTELSSIRKNFHRQEAEQLLLTQVDALGRVAFVLDTSVPGKRGLTTKGSQTVWVRPLAAVSLQNLGQIAAHAQPGSLMTVYALEPEALASSLSWRLTRTGHEGVPTLKTVALFWAQVGQEDLRREQHVADLRKKSLDARKALVSSRRTAGAARLGDKGRLLETKKASADARARYEEAAQRADGLREIAPAHGSALGAAAHVTVSYGVKDVSFDVPVPVKAQTVPVSPIVRTSLAATRIAGPWDFLQKQTPEVALAIVASRIPWHARPMAILGVEFRGIRLLQILPCVLLTLLGLVSLRMRGAPRAGREADAALAAAQP